MSRKLRLRLFIGIGTSLILSVFVFTEASRTRTFWVVVAVLTYISAFVAIQLLGDRLFAPENRRASQLSAIVAGFSSVFLNRFLPDGAWMIVFAAVVTGSFFGLTWAATARHESSQSH